MTVRRLPDAADLGRMPRVCAGEEEGHVGVLGRLAPVLPPAGAKALPALNAREFRLHQGRAVMQCHAAKSPMSAEAVAVSFRS